MPLVPLRPRPLVRLLCAALCLAGAVACRPAGPEALPSSPVQSIRDLYGQTVAVCVGTTHDRYLSAHHPQVKLFRVDEAGYAILPVLTGQVSAALMGGALAKVVVRENPALRMVEEAVFEEPIALAFHDPALRDDFNRFADSLRACGILQEIVDKWINDPGDLLQDWEALFPKTYKGKDFYVAAAWVMPYAFVRHGRVCGLDAELLGRYCAARGLRPHWRNMGFGGLMAALKAGQADAACGGIAYSQERGRAAHFASPHLYSKATLVVRKAPEAKWAPTGFFRSLARRFHKSFVVEGRWQLLVLGVYNTLRISFLSLLLGGLCALPLCGLLRGRLRAGRALARGWLALAQGIPQVVLLMLVSYAVFAGSRIEGLWLAVWTFTFYFAAVVARLLHNALDSLDPWQLEAGRAMGFSPRGLFWHLRFPQALRRIFPLLKGRILALVKLTSIVGLVSIWDLTKAGDLIRSRSFDALLPLIVLSVVYFLLAWLVAKCVEWLQETLIRHSL